jgi:hypothetical protein
MILTQVEVSSSRVSHPPGGSAAPSTAMDRERQRRRIACLFDRPTKERALLRVRYKSNFRRVYVNANPLTRKATNSAAAQKES